MNMREKQEGKYGKWLGGGLGWVLGGPIGGLIGFVLGSLFDTASESPAVFDPDTAHSRNRSTEGNDFMVSLLVLSAAVMKADGRKLKSELDFIKTYLRKQFGDEKTVEYLQILKKLLEAEIPVRQVCMQIRSNMDHPSRLHLMHYLFGIAAADGTVDAAEQHVLRLIGEYLHINVQDQASLMAMFAKDRESAYRILEVDSSASDEELKKAYRRMAAKYHPDKVAQLGEEAMKAAEDKFRKVQEAYEEIKKQRNIK
jgi:DnaJ like chaperone protein